ncbi:MAG TPA: capsule assembly Wzi family protein [Longimicrobiaceae bacterium]|nr:capsule assembly Wzi family protein [Longimicrobiaceae bacterium]
MRRSLQSIVFLALISSFITSARPLAAQVTADTVISVSRLPNVGLRWRDLPGIHAQAVERKRLDQLRGVGDEHSLLLRAPSTLFETLPPPPGWLRVTLLLPEIRSVWNSGIPVPSQEYPGWEGRASNLLLTTGVELRYGPVRLILAPELTYQDNTDFQTIVYPLSKIPHRSTFASPFHAPPHSLDTPLRFGPTARTRIGLGQSSLTVGAGPIEVGVATENFWWGPGIRNALVMSDNAAGFPHAFLRTGDPLDTGLGELEARWIVGELAESDYFDADRSNDDRVLSAAALVLRPAFQPNLSLGITRAVYSLESGQGVEITSPFDVFRDIGRPNAANGDTDAEGRAYDQIFSLFGRWLFPQSGFETYAEWARFEQPRSFGDFLETPNHTQGYTLGLQWAKPIDELSTLRIQGELTNLELSSTYRTRRVISSYASTVIPQGYTNRGQVIGASIGPGASSQWLAADFFHDRWNLGAFGGRIRWDNAAYYDVIPNATYLGHDVSIFAGVRGALQVRGFEISTRLQMGNRYNYLFQNYARAIDDVSAVDIRNFTAQFTLRALH